MMCAVSLIFAFQDVFSRILGGGYPPVLIVMIRYWVFALFVIALVARQPGGLKRAIRTKRPLTQIARGVILALEVLIMVCLLYTSPSPRDRQKSRMPSSA